MSTALALSPLAPGQTSLLGESDDRAAPAQAGGSASGTTRRKPRSLDDLIVDTWEGLVRGTSLCPVCGGRMEPQDGSHARPIAGRCADCGSTLH